MQVPVTEKLCLLLQDFATRSLNVSEQSLAALETLKDNDETNIEQYQMRRTWETRYINGVKRLLLLAALCPHIVSLFNIFTFKITLSHFVRAFHKH